MRRNRELELYIHVPFCIKKCAYCDFLSGPQDERTIENYVERLLDEICAYSSNMEVTKNYQVSTVFLGGGTPSVLSANQMERIFDALNRTFDIVSDAEITIEANPGTVTREKLEAYKKCGINRISFGLQSTNNEELKLLGRIHTYEEFLESYQLTRECGFDNINVDLISAIPKQTVESWEKTLSEVIALSPEHISAYSLIVEDGTPFAKMYGEGCPREHDLPSEEEERIIYYRTEELIEKAGYHRYEISNYAREGKECRHNLGYWERKEYLGIGLGAASLIDNTRFKNTDELLYYMEHTDDLNAIRENVEILSIREQMEEFMFLGLREIKGVSISAFESAFGKSMEEHYGEQIHKLIEQGLLEKKDGRLMLTKQGIDVSNSVFAEFLM
jgi:oxygen-independent coproporphyrinogen-3 oxidase